MNEALTANDALAAGFQEAVVEVLSYKVIRAAKEKKCRHLALVGGVAANSRLRDKVRSDAARQGITVHIPSLHLCGDNAAMIAWAGLERLALGLTDGFDFAPRPRWPLEALTEGENAA